MSAAPASSRVRPAPARHAVLARRAQLVAGAAVAYNVVEAVVAISAGVAASSVALVAFAGRCSSSGSRSSPSPPT